MLFSVKCKKADGTPDLIEVEAESRAAVSAILEKRGVAPVKIDEIAPKACGWNRPTGASDPFGSAGDAKRRRRFAWAAHGVLVLAVAVGAWFLFVVRVTPVRPAAPAQAARPKVQDARPKSQPPPKELPPQPEETHKEKVLRIRREMDDQVKEFIRKSPTNKIQWVVAPLDPDDPDNALRTSIARDIGTLLSIQPGESIPPCIPFSFMFEDDAIAAAAARGDGVLTVDGGNKKFLEDIKKWKVTVKEGDSEARIKAKNDLVDAQLELLKGIDEGVSVNDSIRAAYRYRIEAAKTRSSLMDTIREMHREDPDVEVTRALVRRANEQLAADGIIPISEEAVIPEEDLIAADDEANAGAGGGQEDVP